MTAAIPPSPTAEWHRAGAMRPGTWSEWGKGVADGTRDLVNGVGDVVRDAGNGLRDAGQAVKTRLTGTCDP